MTGAGGMTTDDGVGSTVIRQVAKPGPEQRGKRGEDQNDDDDRRRQAAAGRGRRFKCNG